MFTEKIFIFGNFNIQPRGNCSIWGKTEGNMVYRTQFRSKISKNFECVLKKKHFMLASVIEALPISVYN